MNEKTKSYLQRIKKLMYLYFMSVLAVVFLAGPVVYAFGVTSAIVKIVISAFGCFYGAYTIYNESFWYGNNDKKPYFKLKNSPLRAFVLCVVSLATSMILALMICFTAVLLLKLIAFFIPGGEGEVFTWTSNISSSLFFILFRTCISPFYWASRLLGGSLWIYPFAMMLYPASSALGYFKGWNADVMNRINRDVKRKAEKSRIKKEKLEKEAATLDEYHKEFFEELEEQEKKKLTDKSLFL